MNTLQSLRTLAVTTIVVAGLLACTSARVTSGGGPSMQQARSEAYDGPKARIAVIDFEDKMSSSGTYRAEYGRGMEDMLTTALTQTNRYIVLERGKIAAVEAERKRYGRGNAPKLEDADIMIVGAITGFDPKSVGGSGALGGLLGGNKLLSGLVGSVEQAHVAMDLRVVEVATGRVISATSVEGKSTGVGAGAGAIGVSLAGGLSGFAKGPMETAIREMIGTAVNYVVANTPKQYYRYR